MARRSLPDALQVPWDIKDVLILISAWFGLQLVSGQILAQFYGHIHWVTQFVNGVRHGDIGASFGLDLFGVVIGMILVGLFIRRYHVGWQAVGWRKFSPWQALKYLLLIIIGFIILANLALWLAQILVPGFNANQPQTNDFTKGVASHPNLALIALVLVPPIFEETIFRGFMFPAISRRAGVIWGAVISSVVFGLAHGQANLFVYTAILGMFLCFMYYRTKSIIPGMILHMLNNLLAFWALGQK